MGVEIWVKVGDPPPTNPKELSFLSVDTRTPYVVDYPGKEGGKPAHYVLRWVATTGEKGPPALDGSPRAKPAVARQRVLAVCQGWS